MKNKLSTIIFATIILSLSLLCYIIPDNEYSNSERRPLAQFPTLTAEAISTGEFMDGFEEYATDQFPLREKFRAIKAFFSTYILRKADNNGLFVADGHISKIDEEENEHMMDYASKKFSFINDKYLKDKNTNLYFSIVPDKNFFIAEKNGYPSLDYKGFIERMRKKTDYMNYIDIIPLLSIDDYYKTDTHWKQENITDIAKSITNKMGLDLSDEYKVNTLDFAFDGVYKGQLALPFKSDTIKYLTNETIDNSVVTYYDTGSPKLGDMYDMKKAYSKDPYEMFLSGVAPLITIENQNADLQKELVMFRDSFGSSLAPLMAEAYKKITLVDIRYINSNMLGNFINFENCDVLFIYSTALLNNSLSMK